MTERDTMRRPADGPSAPADEIGAVVREAGTIDWADTASARRATARILERLAAREGLLAAAVTALGEGEGGSAGDRESYPNMDKLVLWASADRAIRLRLHLFWPGYDDRPHNHRWSFAARLLAGRYQHALYGEEGEVLARAREGDARVPRYIHDVPTGGDYFLDHRLVHGLSTDEITASLILRGPSVKDGYFTLDGPRGEVTWSSGAATETAQERTAKTMSPERFATVVAKLTDLGVI
ncbi:hypothetical protein E1264_01765 [Actinomadura sp. KC216]|uniref:hypothetical protein n=1 Tax=Actinomadura sp. KC216 TaxID=2530370 RepID=UPI0010454B2B|nr:hypothetical protein [Actinomadura sp. KC216]TDB91382.1 hypothetical protein E1264_01765 [Actinomadura sp. KC216]